MLFVCLYVKKKKKILLRVQREKNILKWIGKNMSELVSHWVSHSHSLVPHMFSNENNKLETYMYVRTK